MSSLSEPALCLPQRRTFSQRKDINICSQSVLLYGVLEQRSQINQDWLTLFGNENIYKIVPGTNLQTAKIPKFSGDWISLRNQRYLLKFVHQLDASTIYVDITGLPHHIWMPLVRVCIEADVSTNCIYVEPRSYRYNPTPKPGEFFDLSERNPRVFTDPNICTIGR